MTLPARPSSPDAVIPGRGLEEAVRTLNHGTRDAAFIADVADLYALLGSLREVAAGLPQLIDQLDGVPQRWQILNEVVVVDGAHAGDPAAAAAAVTGALRRQGAPAAEQLRQALDDAFQVVASLAHPQGASSVPTRD